MLKHLEIAPDALEVGYILDEDVYENRVLLIRKGQVVTDHIKELLQTRKTVKIVRHVPEESVYLEKDLSDDRIVRLNEQVKTRIKEDVTKLFDDIESDSNASLAQNISDTIVNDVLKKDGVGLNLDELKVSDEYTFKHSVDVAAGSIILAKYLGLGADNIRDIGTAGVLHDIGKSQIPIEVLNKPGKLTEDERELVNLHPEYGYEMLKDSDFISSVVRVSVLEHHENEDGSGYPNGYDKKKIYLFAKIIHICDVYEAMLSKRSYKKRLNPSDVIEYMMGNAGIMFNKEYNNLKFDIYKVEVGVLWNEDEGHEDYDCYNNVYDKQYGYYDENVAFELDYNKALDRTNKLLEL